MDNSEIWLENVLKHTDNLIGWASKNIDIKNVADKDIFFECLWGILRLLAYQTSDEVGRYPAFIWSQLDIQTFMKSVERPLKMYFDVQTVKDFANYLQNDVRLNKFPDLITMQRFFGKIIVKCPTPTPSFLGKFSKLFTIDIKDSTFVTGNFTWEYNPNGFFEKLSGTYKEHFRFDPIDVTNGVYQGRVRKAREYAQTVLEYVLATNKEKELEAAKKQRRAEELLVKEKEAEEEQKKLKKLFSVYDSGIHYFIIKKRSKRCLRNPNQKKILKRKANQ